MAIEGYDTITDTKGAKKSIIDKLSYIKTVETPIWDIAQRGVAENTTYYWNYVSYTAPSATGAKVQGATLTHETPETEYQFTQYTEINARTYRVTSSMESTAKNGGRVGRRSEVGRLKTESAEIVKMYCEWSYLNGSKGICDGSSTPAYMAGLNTIAASGVTPSDIASSTFGATNGEVAMEAHMIALRAAGGLMGKRKLIYLSYTQKNALKEWTGIATAVHTMASDQKIYSNVKVWETMYGPVQVAGHDLQPDDYVLTLNPDEIYIDVLTPSNSKVNAIGALFTEFAYNNETAVRYQKVASMGLATLT